MWFENIPVNINNNGDPLIDKEIENTVEKIKSLEGYSNIFHICTKSVPSEYAFSLLEELTEKQKKNLFLSYFSPLFLKNLYYLTWHKHLI